VNAIWGQSSRPENFALGAKAVQWIREIQGNLIKLKNLKQKQEKYKHLKMPIFLLIESNYSDDGETNSVNLDCCHFEEPIGFHLFETKFH